MSRRVIRVLGGRGIPACYSGYDTLVERVAPGLAQHEDLEIIVYCRSSYYPARPASFKGVRLVYLPAPRVKGIESLLHSFMSSLHAATHGVDVVYFLDPANAPFVVLLRLLGVRVVVHTDGLGWKRRKWGRAARLYYRFVERVVAWAATGLVTDNEVMREYYSRTYGVDSNLIAYGAENDAGLDESVLSALGLDAGRYLLVVARLEPENNTDLIIREYVKSATELPLVVVGDAPYGARFLRRLRELANERVVFAGRINDQAKLNGLYANAFLYVHAHEVGGTNPSLLRAMGLGVAPIVLNVPFNTSVIQECGFQFGSGDGELAGLLRRLVADEGAVKVAGTLARRRASSYYTWDLVVDQHYELLRGLCLGAQ